MWEVLLLLLRDGKEHVTRVCVGHEYQTLVIRGTNCASAAYCGINRRVRKRNRNAPARLNILPVNESCAGILGPSASQKSLASYISVKVSGCYQTRLAGVLKKSDRLLCQTHVQFNKSAISSLSSEVSCVVKAEPNPQGCSVSPKHHWVAKRFHRRDFRRFVVPHFITREQGRATCL